MVTQPWIGSAGAAVAVAALLAWLVLATSEAGDTGPSGTDGPGSVVDPQGGGADREPDGDPVASLDGPCARPILWRIAAVDPRFGMDPDRAREAVEAAAKLWEEGAGRPLFRHDPDHGFPILFIHDERQARTRERQGLESALHHRGAELEAQLLALEEALQELKARGGSTGPGGGRDEVEKLRVRQADLTARLEAHRSEVAEVADRFPPTPVESATHRLLALRGPDGTATLRHEIRVFRFDDDRDLVRILAHELGHALGLDHATAPGAVMSPEYGRREQESGAPTLSPADLQLLGEACSEPQGSVAPENDGP
jgi:hypothetical protein